MLILVAGFWDYGEVRGPLHIDVNFWAEDYGVLRGPLYFDLRDYGGLRGPSDVELNLGRDTPRYLICRFELRGMDILRCRF